MPKLNFKAPADSALVNDSFLGRTSDDVATGVISLDNITDPNSGNTINNTQQYINEIADAVGVDGEGDAARKDYSSNNFVTNGEDHKEAIGVLDTSLQAVLDQVNEGEIKLKAYADDASYEADNGAPPYVGYTAIYYNTTDGKVTYYNDVEAQWDKVGAGGVANREDIGTGNGVTVDFSLTLFPTSVESVMILRNGIAVKTSDYSININTGVVTFNTAPATGQFIGAFYLTEGDPVTPPVTSGTFEVEYFDVDSTVLSNKQLTLGNTPSNPTKVLVDVIGGSPQRYGVDYTVSGSTVSWNTLRLDGQIVLNDELRITYFY